MKFINISDPTDVENYLYLQIEEATQKYENITWIVSGGSNIVLTSDVFKRLSDDQLAKLTILLSDERYGSVGHPNSNYFQLKQAGVDFNKVKSTPVLISNDATLEQTAKIYNKVINDQFENSDFIIGQLGIGPDGHTVGILPNSNATEDVQNLITYYKGVDYQRITLTFNGIRQISTVLVFCFGENKRLAISELANSNLSLKEQPAKIFRQLADAYIINDMIGEPE